LAVIITIAAVLYQRLTGPTYPKRLSITNSKNEEFKIRLPRSHGGESNAEVELVKFEEDLKAYLNFKRYPTSDEWAKVEFLDLKNRLVSTLPKQPPAGKVIYYIDFKSNNKKHQSIGSAIDPIYIRFKGDVPTYILAPHVFFMFLSMLFSALAFGEAIFKTDSAIKIARITLGSLFIGGMILGPLVQKHAFGVYWAGFPYDWDLTDNKLLIAVVVWTLANLLTMKKKRMWPIIVAAIALILVYSIPHSMQGSEYNYEKGKVITDRD
jgi:hypothetical protein